MAPSEVNREALRALPGVDTAMVWEELSPIHEELRVEALRAVVADARQAILAGESHEAPTRESVVAAVREYVRQALRPSLSRVINATGVLLHTNLGRAPLAPSAVSEDAMRASAYTNLEMFLETGARGGRGKGVFDLLCALSGAEAALVVNNTAAAVLLGISALAAGREVVVSRGELVEIGGSFRVPAVISQGGAILHEVGTTNRTRRRDFDEAIGPQTAGFLKAHASNFQIVGFTEEVDIATLVELARERSEGREEPLFVMEDLGSATFLPLTPDGSLPSPTPRAALEAGADLVCFSGDKLIGGPQAGILLGRKWAIERAAKHPLYRALRPGKITLAVLEATLRLHTSESLGRSGLPLHHMASIPVAELERRAETIAELLNAALSGATAAVVATRATLGGGSIPGQEIPSVGVELSLDGRDAGELAGALRLLHEPIVGVLREGKLVLDLRTVEAADDPLVVNAVCDALEHVKQKERAQQEVAP